ncbi:MAG: OmpH family outer membrane protein [Armatimonadetes bacterium]|nr:OmpH family outer membrane protein [Armatimonadota bacterium]
MLILRKIIRVLGIIAAVAAVSSMAFPVWGAESAPKIGVIDIQKILTEAPRMKQYEEEYQNLRNQLQRNLDIRSQNLMLDENEIKELIDLKTKPNPTEAEKARIAELEKIEKQRDSRLKELQAIKEPSEAQKAELKSLQEMRSKSETTGRAVEEDYLSRLQTKTQESYKKMDADLQEAVNKVVEVKGLTLVLVKDAVRFGGIDITDDVISKLERKVQ